MSEDTEYLVAFITYKSGYDNVYVKWAYFAFLLIGLAVCAFFLKAAV